MGGSTDDRAQTRRSGHATAEEPRREEAEKGGTGDGGGAGFGRVAGRGG